MNTKATQDAQATRDAARNAYIAKRYQSSTGAITRDHASDEVSANTWKSLSTRGRVVRDGECVVANLAIMDSALVEIERGESYTDALKRQIRALQEELVQEEKRSKDRAAEVEAETYTPPTSDAQQARSASYDAFLAKRHRATGDAA